MKKETTKWSVETLQKRFRGISFPEYQREPNVWPRVAKQRLIDSILRDFDIAALYFYKNDDDSFDCVDGRQRIGAIMSFLGENEDDQDNCFRFQIFNEIYQDTDHPFSELEQKTFEEICNRTESDEVASRFEATILKYEITTVVLAETEDASEFNLQFTRLNLGTIINSGEKLHAMVGALRNLCFEDLGRHPFLTLIKIPARRFSREQLAARSWHRCFRLKIRKRTELGVLQEHAILTYSDCSKET